MSDRERNPADGVVGIEQERVTRPSSCDLIERDDCFLSGTPGLAQCPATSTGLRARPRRSSDSRHASEVVKGAQGGAIRDATEEQRG